MQFEKPEFERDVTKGLLLSALALAKLRFQDPVSAAEAIPDIWKKITGELTNRPENLAWIFLSNCVATAVVSLLKEPRMRCELSEEEMQGIALELVELIPDRGELHSSDIINLALSPTVSDCTDRIIEVARQKASDRHFSDDQVKVMFQDALALSVTRVFEAQRALFGGIVEILTGAASVAEMRDRAWRRHGAWVRSLYSEEPIFSPDSDVDIPLSHVYQRLRCFWNEEHSKKQPEGREVQKNRTAHIANLHETLTTWLDSGSESDGVRLVAGGPGSGKSSFAKAFACDVLARNSHRLLFIRLQHIATRGTLRQSIGAFLHDRHGYRVPNNCEGFPENPLEWHGEGGRPLLMIFDGLDELTANQDRENDLTRRFVSNLKNELRNLNAAGQTASAIVLGRTTAMQSARHEADLPLPSMIHVAPIRPIERGDLHLENNPEDEVIGKGFSAIKDPANLMGDDSREVYWERWCRVKGREPGVKPDAITDESMADLNVEPLLLHLLIISAYCGERWAEAAKNRNLVYKDILSKVFDRNKKKKLEAYKRLDLHHFFELMEVFGLAAFRGNGRTGDQEDFVKLRNRYVTSRRQREFYADLDGAGLKNVALMVHSRLDADGGGFEFVHKSFGEYLAARALIGAARRLQERRDAENGNDSDEDLSLSWVNLIGDAQCTEAVLRFLKDEAALQSESATQAMISALTGIFDHTLREGFPAHNSKDLPDSSYRTLERRQNSAELCMLVTLTSLWSAQFQKLDRDTLDKQERILLPTIQKSLGAASGMLERLFHIAGAGIRPQLMGFDLKASNLFWSRLVRADLRNADLSEANLSGANLSNAYLRNADLSGADLRGADLSDANLTGADLSDAYLSDANLNGAYLVGADLSDANLTGADLSNVDLSGADLSNADLSGADLRGADLRGANLQSTFLRDCNIAATSLRKVDCSQCHELTQIQLDLSFGVRSGFGMTQLPESLSPPQHWHAAQDAEEDSEELSRVYREDYEKWRESL